MGIHEELEVFLMCQLSEISYFIEEDSERAIAVAETIAARGNEIPEYLLQMYICKVPVSQHYLEGAIAYVMGLGLLDITCSCSCEEERLFCFRESLVQNEEYSRAKQPSRLAEHVKHSVEKLRDLMYDDCVR